MQFSALQIATHIGGRIEGNPDAKVSGVAKIEEANEGQLSFIANPKYQEYLYTTHASILIINEDLPVTAYVTPTLIRVKDAYNGFASLLVLYNEMMSRRNKKGIEQLAHVATSATLGENVYIGAFSYIGENVTLGENVQIYPGCYVGDDVCIGADSKIYAGVKIYDGCKIGANVIIHSGSVIGADGFGFAPEPDGSYKKIPQIGTVIIEDNVEIGSNTTVDRATMGATIVRNGVKLDNLIQIGHNAEIGAHTVIAAQTGVSGSTKVGKGCLIGGQVGIVGHIHIADGTKVNAKSGISKSVEQADTSINGSPAFDYRASLKSQAVYRNLPELMQRIAHLEEELKALSAVIK
ncbi:MAG: UDP-3-O-(3-hydroxymyristoyl)glucosamine N-acyltransferase [Chitinophagaceae bacterium]